MNMCEVHRVLGHGSAWGQFLLAQTSQCAGEAERCWRENEGYALNIVVRGEGRFWMSDGECSPLGPGSIYQHFPKGGSKKARLEWCSDEVEEIYLILDERLYLRLQAFHLFPECALLPPQPIRRLHAAVVDMAERLERTRFPVRFELNRPALGGVVMFLSELFDLIETGVSRFSLDPLIEEVCERLVANPRGRESLSDLSRSVGISYSALRKRFRASMGLSLNRYRIQHRIDAAQRFLRTHNVKETAAYFGYSDAFVFSAQFKRLTGMSPRCYQREEGGV